MSSGIDILLMDTPGLEELRRALATTLDVPLEQVNVVSSIDDLTGDPLVAAEQFPVKGEFRSQVAVYLRREPRPSLGMEEVRALSRLLGSAMLVPDESPNPYTGLLIRPDGSERPVGLQAESLDERGEYRLLTD